MRPIKIIIVIFLLVSSFIGYYNLTGKTIYSEEQVYVSRAVDGDTVDSSIGKIRLLGINTPEKKMPYYSEAKEFLKNLTEGKTVKVVKIEGNTRDKYGRMLGYIFIEDLFVNEEILKAGMANLYFYDEDPYIGRLKDAEKFAREKGIGIWIKSKNFGCLKLLSLDYNEGSNRCANNEQVVIENSCEAMNVIMKDDANHIFNETIVQGKFVKNFSCTWNDDRDRMFIRDETGLILYYEY